MNNTSINDRSNREKVEYLGGNAAQWIYEREPMIEQLCRSYWTHFVLAEESFGLEGKVKILQFHYGAMSALRESIMDMLKIREYSNGSNITYLFDDLQRLTRPEFTKSGIEPELERNCGHNG